MTQLEIQLQYPLSKMLKCFRFWERLDLEYLHYPYWLSIPESENLKSEMAPMYISYECHVNAQKVSDFRPFWILDSQI